MPELGLFVDAGAVRRELQAMLELNLPGVIDLARSTLPAATQPLAVAPREWRRLPDFRELTLEQSPAIVVTSPGLLAEPQRASDLPAGAGIYSAAFGAHVYAVVRAGTYEQTADLVGFYAACVRLAVLRFGLPGVPGALVPRWTGEGYSEIPERGKARTLGAGVVTFAVTVRDVVQEIDPSGSEVASTLVTVDADL